MAAPTATAWIPSCAGLPNSSAVGDAVQALLREHAGQQRADGPADAVRRDDVERVVELRLRAPQQAEVARHGGDRAERNRAHRPDEAGGGRDRDQADDDRRGGADRGRLALPHGVEQRPDDQRARRRQHRRREGERREAFGRERAAGVEPEPAEPEQAGAEQRERHVVRQQRPTDLKSRRRPTTRAATSAATPALTCTTVPPAKSSAPILASQPPPHTQCAIGL